MKQAELIWRDGQPVSSRFDDVYFSRDGGLAETEHVFLHHNHLPQRWQDVTGFVIGETGFGSGLNFLTTVHHWLQQAPAHACLYYYSVEKYPLGVEDLGRALSAFPELSDYSQALLQVYPEAIGGLHVRWLFGRRVCLLLMFDDVVSALAQLDTPMDAWFLDGFAPARNPAMWSDEVFAQVARLSHSQTSLATYTASGFVRRGLAAQGFQMERVAGFGNKREMLRGLMRQAPGVRQAQPWFEAPPVSGPREVAVIGAGIAGVTSAWALARRGWRVSLIDRHDRVAAEASGNPLGVVLPRLSRESSAAADFDNAAFAHSVHQLGRLQAACPELGWRQSGVVQLPSSSRIRQHIQQGEFDARLAHSIQADQLRARCGLQLNTPALYYPLAGYLNPSGLCEALCDDAGDALQLIRHSQVHRIQREHEQWLLFDQQGRLLLSSPHVVIANGYNALRFEQTAKLPLTPVRGQISYLASTAQTEKLTCPLCYDGYVLPAEQGRHVIGASFIADNSDDALVDHEHAENINALQRWLPQLFDGARAEGGRAAVRAVTPDRLPLLGPVADADFFHQHYADLQRGRAAHCYPRARYLPGLYVNVGHGARGLTSSFLCAELLAAQLDGDRLPVYRRVKDALHPARFMIRAFKKGKSVFP